MHFENIVQIVQRELKNTKFDGWLIYDYCGSNSIFFDLFGLKWHATRRFFLLIPKEGKPSVIFHQIEEIPSFNKEVRYLPYKTFSALNDLLSRLAEESPRVLMEYSPIGAIAQISKLDAGTYQLLLQHGFQISSSKDLISQLFIENLDHSSHQVAAKRLGKSFDECWSYLQNRIEEKNVIFERDFQETAKKILEKNQLIDFDVPIVAANQNSAKPHYAIIGNGSPITKGSIVLLDMWGRIDQPQSIFSDMTQMAIIGRKPTDFENEIFSIVYEAQDRAIHTILSNEIPLGKHADESARKWISSKGYGEFFCHRLGHSIDQKLHGRSANLDDFESNDDRKILPGAIFSIEPGIYLEGKFGVRLECNAHYTRNRNVEITTKRQKNWILL